MKKLLPIAAILLASCNDLTEPPQPPAKTSEYTALCDTFYAQVGYLSNGKKVNRLGKAVLKRFIVFRDCESVGHYTNVGDVLINGAVIATDSIVSLDFGGIKY